MRTTINIDDEIAKEIFAISSDKSRTAAINNALNEWIRYKKRMQLINMRGNIDIDDNIEKLRKLELKKKSNGK